MKEEKVKWWRVGEYKFGSLKDFYLSTINFWRSDMDLKNLKEEEVKWGGRVEEG